MRQAIQAGVSAYIVEGIHAARLQPILDVAMARFESDQALKAQLLAATCNWPSASASSRPGLADEDEDCNEEQAYTLMRRQAMSPAEADPGGRTDHRHVGDAGLMLKICASPPEVGPSLASQQNSPVAQRRDTR
jgi:hypothetical protein